MVDGENRQLGDAARLVEADIDRQLVAGGFAGAQEAGVANLAAELDLEPVRRIVPGDVGVELRLRPFGEADAEFGLRRLDAAGAGGPGEAAGEGRLGLVIQRAQQLCLPAVPDPWADAADVGGGKNG